MGTPKKAQKYNLPPSEGVPQGGGVIESSESEQKKFGMILFVYF